MSSIKAEAENISERVESAEPTKSTQLQDTKDSVLAGAERLRAQGSQALQQSWSTAKQARNDVDERFLQPTRDMASNAFSKHPLAVTFLAAWLALSFMPVLLFIVWTLGSIAIVVGVAVTVSLSILAFLIGTAGLLLLGTLGTTFCLALVATFWLAVAWGGYRLLFAITNEPSLPEAISRFRGELKVLLLGQAGLSEGQTDAAKTLGIKSEASS